MPKTPSPSARQHELYCRHCKEKFVAYRDVLTPQCPRCGRTTRMPLERRWLRLAAVAIIVAVLVTVLVVYILRP